MQNFNSRRKNMFYKGSWGKSKLLKETAHKNPHMSHVLFEEVASIYKGKKPYKCENCDKVFCKSISMIIYMYNTLKFVGNDRLEKHILTVHEKKSFKFELCNFKFLAPCFLHKNIGQAVHEKN